MWEESGGGGVGIFKVGTRLLQKLANVVTGRLRRVSSSLFQLLLAIISTLLLFVAVDDGNNDDSW